VTTHLATFALAGTLAPAALAADTEDWTPTGIDAANTILVAQTASWRLGGIAGGWAGRLLLLHNVSAYSSILVSDSAASAAANRFDLPVSRLTIDPGSVLPIHYDGAAQRWRPLVQMRRLQHLEDIVLAQMGAV
jgi:hypothetical protein